MNPHTGEVSITMGGKDRVFRASLKALAEAEHASGERIMDWIDKGLSLHACRWLLFYSSVEPLDMAEIEKWVDELGFVAVREATEELFYLSIVGKKDRDRIFEEMQEKSDPKKNEEIVGIGSQ